MTNQIKKTINDNLGKVTDTLVTPVNQRLSNPLIGSFALSWAILNWQPIIFLLVSNKNIEDKFSYIKEHFYGVEWSGWLSWCMYLIFPLLISILYAIGLPRLENLLEALNLKPRENKMSRVHTLNMKEYSHRIAYAKSQAEIENVKANYMEVEDLNQKITLLNEQIRERNKTIEDYNSQLTELRSAYNEDLKEFSTTKERFDIASRDLSNILIELKDVLLEHYKEGLLSKEQDILIEKILSLPSFPYEYKRHISEILSLRLEEERTNLYRNVILIPVPDVSTESLMNSVNAALRNLNIRYRNIRVNDNKSIVVDVYKQPDISETKLHNTLISLPEIADIYFK